MSKRSTALLMAAGILIGATMVAPAGAHVGGSVGHLWKKHIRPLADKRFFTKQQANNRFLSETITVVESSGSIPVDNFGFARADCPEGYKVVGGGMDPSNVLTTSVTSNGPVFPTGMFGGRLVGKEDGVNEAPIGWRATVRNDSASTQDFKVGVICAR